MKLYMWITRDKYELPIMVTPSITELARASGKGYKNLESIISKYRKGKIKQPEFIEVFVDE